jgi:hypothetical protein
MEKAMIFIKNESSNILQIVSMGLEISPQDEVQLDSMFTDEQILESPELNNPNISWRMDAEASTYRQVIDNLTKLNVYNHNNLQTLGHNLDKNYYFEVEKTGTQTIIHYYTDSTKTVKLKEDVVDRVNKKASKITSKLFIGNDIVETFEETLHRSGNGRVTSITSNVSRA